MRVYVWSDGPLPTEKTIRKLVEEKGVAADALITASNIDVVLNVDGASIIAMRNNCDAFFVLSSRADEDAYSEVLKKFSEMGKSSSMLRYPDARSHD